jgi:hypothetical protein
MPVVPPALQRANALMAEGNYKVAAQEFEFLARGAEVRFPQRAPQLYLQAGKARILNGEVEAGMAHFKHGLSMMAAAGQLQILQRAGSRIVAELNERGLVKEAEQIRGILQSVPQSAPGGVAASAPTKKPALPTHCPGCGGPVRPDEVEWLDDVTAECIYCGSPVRAE